MINQKRPCTKKKYFSESTAQHAVDYVQGNRKKNKNFKRCDIKSVYKCPYCKFWHTTSQKQRGKK